MSRSTFTEDELMALLYEEEPGLRQYLGYCGIGTNDMDEMLQDILLTVWRKIDTLQDMSSFRPWLRTIAKRKAIRYHKKQELYRNFHYPLSYFEEAQEELGLPVPESLIHEDSENFCHSEVYQMVMALGSPASNILILHYVYSEQFNEIADTLCLNENTVRSIARRSLDKLRKSMNEKGITPHGKKG